MGQLAGTSVSIPRGSRASSLWAAAKVGAVTKAAARKNRYIICLCCLMNLNRGSRMHPELASRALPPLSQDRARFRRLSSPNRQDARPHNSAFAACARRRGDRMRRHAFPISRPPGLRNGVDHKLPESLGMTLNCLFLQRLCRLTRCYRILKLSK
jgi:hypothetical protein